MKTNTKPNPRKNPEIVDPSPTWVIGQPPSTMEGCFLILSMKGGQRMHAVMRDGDLICQENDGFGRNLESSHVFAWMEDR